MACQNVFELSSENVFQLYWSFRGVSLVFASTSDVTELRIKFNLNIKSLSIDDIEQVRHRALITENYLTGHDFQ